MSQEIGGFFSDILDPFTFYALAVCCGGAYESLRGFGGRNHGGYNGMSAVSAADEQMLFLQEEDGVDGF